MIDALQTTVPVFLIIALGFLLRRFAFVPEGFWPAAEKLVYYVLLPALIARSLATRGVDLESFGLLVAAVAAVIVAISLLSLGLGRLWRAPPATLASFHQASIRLNGIVGIAAVNGLLGDAGLPLVAAVVAAWIPLSNGLSVYGFVRAAGAAHGLPGALLQVARNPMILSVGAGLLLSALGLGPSVAAWPLLDILGRAALPVGLLAVGAALTVEAVRAAGSLATASSALKLVVMPGLAYFVGGWLGLGGAELLALVTFAAMPTSPGGYVVAKQLGGDAPFMATTITLQHLAALATLTLTATLMGAFG